jgi:hypothetical protein
VRGSVDPDDDAAGTGLAIARGSAHDGTLLLLDDETAAS